MSDVVSLDSKSIKSYELITEEHFKSAKSGVARGLVGGALLGPLGVLAGTFSARNKGSYTIALLFNDGKNSLVELDSKAYKNLVSRCYSNYSQQSDSNAAVFMGLSAEKVSPNNEDLITKLEKIKKLHAQKVITDEEFDEQKKLILEKI